ncbi:MAG TPA: helix-turn-helix transcriptional regulator [Nevskia sp.]|nr:helix-turn-helix transcriptional regulator [Nevskia sp.]
MIDCVDAGGDSMLLSETALKFPFRPLGRTTLTRREKQILAGLREGMSNKEIAGRIRRTEDTVKFHLKNIYKKLGVSGRTQAILVAMSEELPERSAWEVKHRAGR